MRKSILFSFIGFGALSMAVALPAAFGNTFQFPRQSPNGIANVETINGSTAKSVIDANPVSLLDNGGWLDNGDSVYTFSSVAAGLSVHYSKSTEWANAKYSFNGQLRTDVSNKTKLAVKGYFSNGSLDCTNSILLKFVYTDSSSTERRFQLTSTEYLHEWNVSSLSLSSISEILLFVDPGVSGTYGDLVFSSLSFETGDYQDYVKNTYSSGDAFDVMSKWHDGGDFSYAISESANSTTIEYGKWTSSQWYNSLTVANNVNSFSYLNVKAQGPAGKTAVFKVQCAAGNVEKTVTFDENGLENCFTIDVSSIGMVEAGDVTVLLFAEGGSDAANHGKIILSKACFSNSMLVANAEAEAYGLSFLGGLNCDSTGVLAPSASEWGTLSDSYSSLGDSAKEALRSAIPNEDGSNLERCVARYDLVVKKYGSEAYANFMNRAVSGSSSNTAITFDSDSIALIMVLGVSTVAFVTLYALLASKKKKAR